MNLFKSISSATPQNTDYIPAHMLAEVCARYKERIAALQSEQPLVSIVVPAHNEERCMLRMVESMSNLQTQFPLEIIGVDNNSTDATGAIFEQCGFKCLKEDKKGTSHARQTGLEEAKGAYIFTTDSDTVVPSTWVEKALSYFQKESDLVFLSGGLTFVGAHWSFYCAQHLLKTGRFLLGKEYKTRSCFTGANSVYRKDIAMQVGGYEPGRDKGEDILIAQKMGNHGEMMGICDDPEIRVTTSGRRFASISKVIKHATGWRPGRSVCHECLEMERCFEDIR